MIYAAWRADGFKFLSVHQLDRLNHIVNVQLGKQMFRWIKSKLLMQENGRHSEGIEKLRGTDTWLIKSQCVALDPLLEAYRRKQRGPIL
jgi:hypothetical protein